MISEHPTCLFIADMDVLPTEIDISFFLTAIESAFAKTDSIDYNYRVPTQTGRDLL